MLRRANWLLLTLQQPRATLLEYLATCVEFVQNFFIPHATSSASFQKKKLSVASTSLQLTTRRSVSLHSPSQLLSVPHNLYRIPSRRQCLHHQKISMHEYARYVLYYLRTSDQYQPAESNTAAVTRTVALYLSDTNSQQQQQSTTDRLGRQAIRICSNSG